MVIQQFSPYRKCSPLLWLLASLFVLLASSKTLADVLAVVDRNAVNLEESFNITVTIDNVDSGMSPDFSPLHRDFTVYDTHRSSQRNIINGSYSASTSWQITLIPKRAGKLMIPPLAVNGEVTKAIAITVAKDTSNPMAEQNKELFINAETDITSTYVGAQVLFTVKVYHTVNLVEGSSLNDPEPDNAQVRKVFENNYRSIVNGMAYNVIERRYAIFPNRTGTLEIPPVLLNAVVSNGRSRSLFGSMSGDSRRVIRRTSSIDIVVKDLPADAKAKDAIAVNKLSLNQQWSSDIKQLKVGDSITRNLLITAEGAYAAQLPPLLLNDQDGLKLYSDQPQINDVDTENGVRAQRQESIAIVATKPGDYTLPAVEAWWFDTKSKRLKKASLPAVNFSVAPASNMPATEPETTAAAPIQNNTRLPTSNESAEPELLLGLVKNTVSTWQLIALSFCGLWVITLLYALFKKGAPPTEKPKQTPQTSVTKQDCYKAAMQACKDNKAEQVVSLTLQWAQQHWHSSHINTIATVRAQGAVELADKLQALEAAIYGKGGDSQSLCSDIGKSINDLRKQQSNKKESGQIKPLYKN